MNKVVNRLLVADQGGSFEPRLRLTRKASQRSPAATS